VEAGLTQTTLADALGISFQQLQNTKGPPIGYLLARFITLRSLTLDVPVRDFFDGLSRRDKKRG
jgi:hypothetical protein